MRKVFSVFMTCMLLFGLSSCSKTEEFQAVFNSFHSADNYVLLTHFELVVGGKHYNRSEITYDGRNTNIMFLDERGFYSYALQQSETDIDFLYTTYDTFETTKIGEDCLPEKIINSFYGDNSFWFRVYDPSIDGAKQIYYRWDTVNKEGYIVEDVERSYEYSVDNNRNDVYTFDYVSKGLKHNYLEITDNTTGVKKTIDFSTLKTFKEGKEIAELHIYMLFSPRKAYVMGEDIYFTSTVSAAPLGYQEYTYIVKWNFETEECSLFAYAYFDYYQEWVDDIIILEN